MSTRLILLVPAVVLVAALSSSCGKDPEFPEGPAPSASYTPPPPVTPVATGSAPPPVAPGVTPCDAVQTTAFTTMIAARAASEVPGTEQVGPLVCGVASEGQAAVGQTIMLEQGWCYSVLGNALPNVTELDLALTADITGGIPLPGPLGAIQPQLAVDSTAGNVAAITPGNNCLQWTMPVPGPVKLTVKATRGSGAVGAQVYRKKKAW
jgi:hypothetical protein